MEKVIIHLSDPVNYGCDTDLRGYLRFYFPPLHIPIPVSYEYGKNTSGSSLVIKPIPRTMDYELMYFLLILCRPIPPPLFSIIMPT